MKFGLENIRALCDALGHPERASGRSIVAGTNGKGSVTVMVETALRAAGHRTGALHVAASRPARRAVRHRRTGGRRPSAPRRRARARRGHALRAGRASSRCLRRSSSARRRSAFELFRRGRGRDGGPRGRPRRPARCDERRRRRCVDGDHVDRLRSPGAARQHARVDRAREGRHHQARRAGGLRPAAAPRPTVSSATRVRPRARA